MTYKEQSHDIELPPLPTPFKKAVYATSANTKSVRDGVEMGGYEKEPPLFDDAQMHEYARAAIEADRKRRGEEVDKMPVLEWLPIETAPKDNKRPLFIARFNDDGTMQSFDYDATWESERESWEMPQVYYYLASANGNVEEPSHWCYEPEGFSKLPDVAIDEAMKGE